MANRTTSGSELMAAIRGLSAARELPPEVILEALRAALVSAYHKIPGATESHVTVDINEETGEAHVLSHYTVVDAQYLEDPNGEFTVDQARPYKSDAAVGDTITMDVTPNDFGRIAAQTAKQVILQRIREAEREQTYSTYAEREGEIVYGTIQSTTRDSVTVALDRVESLMPKGHQIPGEQYAPNQRLRVYVAEVKRSPKGPQVIVSRTHRDMLKRLMELEIPEIFQGIVEIKAIAREAGSRSKVAVWSHQEGVDPVGACVGMRGVRIQALVRELGGEKIDIVQWDPDPRVFIANALSPARVRHVWLDEDAERRTANVMVPDDQLSLAIGREGQNARLAAKLTTWRIDIRAESESADLLDQIRSEEEARAAERAEAEAVAVLVEVTAPAPEPAREPMPAEGPVAAPAPGVEAVGPPPTAGGAAPDVSPAAVEPAPAVSPTAQVGPPVVQPKAPSAEALAESEEEEDLLALGRKKGKRGKKPLVRDPVTGRLVPEKGRRGSRQRMEWEEEVGEWVEKDVADLLDFTESDFLGARGEDQSGETDGDDGSEAHDAEAQDQE